jgi:NhaP-type Na+/H+ or K+/H+ antiporter
MPLNLIIVLILLGGWFSSRLFSAMKLPSVLGMLCFGLLLGTRGETVWPAGLVEMEPFLKTFALVVILLRAGLGLKRHVLQKVGRTALAMAIIPCLFEGAVLTLLFHVGWEFSLPVAGLTGFMLAAVSPAVVVPSMLDLAEKGYGRKNEVPTLVLAGASVDDVVAITLFSLFMSMALEPGLAVSRHLLDLPVALVLGILPGLLAGALLILAFRRNRKRVRATEKTLILLMVALLLVEVGDRLQSAALLGVMTVGILLLEYAPPIAHELSAKLQKIWIFAEIILFVLIGMQVDPRLALQAGPAALATLAAGLLARSAGVWLATTRSGLGNRERVFCICAYLPKATVQAALGAVPLSRGIPGGDAILALAVLSVLLTAPLGLFAIRLGGPALLDHSPHTHGEQTTS